MNKHRILIIEDNPDIQGLISVLLEEAGYEVVTADDGTAGVRVALEERPQLILSDYKLPGPMNGVAAIQAIEQGGLIVPSVLITAQGSEDVAVQALRAGMRDYISKPFDSDHLLGIVADLLRDVPTPVSLSEDVTSIRDVLAFSKTADTILDLDRVLPRVLEAVLDLTGAEEGILMLIDSTTGELYTRASRNMEEGLQSMRLPTENTIAGQVFKSGTPILMGGDDKQKIKAEYLVHNLLYVPLNLPTGGEIIGVMGVFNRSGNKQIHVDDLEAVMELANDVASAIHTVRQFEESGQQAAQLDQIFEHVPDPIVAVNGKGRIVMCNQAAQQSLITGESNSAIGRLVVDVMNNQELQDLFLMTNPDPSSEIELENGQIYHVQISEVDDIGRIVVFQNITNLRQLDRMKTDMVTNISHDLRSPLTAILSYIELMKRVGDLNERQSVFTEQTRQSVQMMTELINELLNIDRLDAELGGQVEILSIEELIEHILKSLKGHAHLKGQILEFQTDPDLPAVCGVPMRLRQVFTNLIDNAIKYTPDKGTVRVEISTERNNVVTCVSDTGIGISMDEQIRIFDKGFRASDVSQSHEGRGIGLSIVKSIVEAHSGRIWVESTLGEGTTFTVMLPANRDDE